MALSSSRANKAGEDRSALASARTRRVFYGANVLLMTTLAVAIVVVLNWVATAQSRRIDVASAGIYGLSDRTKKIVNDFPGKEIMLTSIYTSNERDKARDKYLPRVRDLFDELESASRKVKVRHLAGDDEKRELIDRVQGKFAGRSKDYREAVDLAREKWQALEPWLTQTAQQFNQMAANKAWLADFFTFAKISAELARDIEDLQQARREVDEAVGGFGLPRYEQAKRKIEEANNRIKGHLDEAQKWFADLVRTQGVLSDPKGAFGVETERKLAEMKTLAAGLREIAGDPSDETVPDDPAPVLQAFSRQAGKLNAWLTQEISRVDDFAEKNKAISSHRLWTVQVDPIMQMELLGILGLTQQNLIQWDQQIRQILLSNQPKDVLQSAVRRLRKVAGDTRQNLAAWEQSIRGFLGAWQKIDEASAGILEKARKEELFAAPLKDLGEIESRLKGLPELKLEDVASKFEQDNIVVVETEDQVQVVDFDSVWPRADTSPMMAIDDDTERRVFNGDAAIGAAILSLAHKEPFATVVLVSFEPTPAMPQGPRSLAPIPVSELSKLRERLERANFKVKEWNLASDDKAPDPEPNTQAIYVFLPPAEPSQPNPFQRMPQEQKHFGEAELAKVREVLGKENARGLFLASFLWPRRSMFGSTPATYGYDKYLESEWGIDVKFNQRVIRGVPDKQDPNRYGLSVTRWNWMRLNTFNEKNPIGEPLRSRRVLLVDVCPVMPAAKVPEGVGHEVVLGVPAPAGRSEFWAESEIEKLISQIRSPTSDGVVTKGASALNPPFSVILAAENTARKSKVIVHGAGLGVVDNYMEERVPRLGREEKISFDPPPRENGELFVNCMYWLADKPDFIAAGPVTAPPIQAISTGQLRTLRGVMIVWALVVLGAGGAMMYVRRK